MLEVGAERLTKYYIIPAGCLTARANAEILKHISNTNHVGDLYA